MQSRLMLLLLASVCCLAGLWLLLWTPAPLVDRVGGTRTDTAHDGPAASNRPILARPLPTEAAHGSLALRELAADDASLVLHGGCRSHEGMSLQGVTLQLALAERTAGVLVLGAAVANGRSDAKGAFSLAGVLRRGDRYVLQAEHEQWGRWLSDIIDPLRGATLWQDVILGCPGVVDGRVEDRSGTPIVGATVRREDAPQTRIACANDGTFHIESVPATGVQLRVNAPGFRSQVRSVKPGETCVWQLAPGLAVAGTVVDVVAHKPVRGLRVTLRPTDGGASEYAEFSDALGTFRFEGVDDGILLLSVDGALAAPRNVTAGCDPVQIEVTLGPRIEGVLLAADGSAARSGRVALVLFAESGAGALPLQAWSAVDGQGRFSVAARSAGTWFVVAEGPGSARVMSGPVTAPGTARLQLAAGCVAHGQVIDERGVAVVGAAIVFRRVVPARVAASGSSASGVGTSTQVHSAADGSFACNNLAPGEYDPEVTHPSFVARRLARVAFAASNVSMAPIALSRAGELEGLVLDKKGNADATAVVQLVHEGGARHVVSTDASGKFSLMALEPGLWQVGLVQSEGVLLQGASVNTQLKAGQRTFVRIDGR